jgi:hypothetical protein
LSSSSTPTHKKVNKKQKKPPKTGTIPDYQNPETTKPHNNEISKQ